jgi:hypothetical protein
MYIIVGARLQVLQDPARFTAEMRHSKDGALVDVVVNGLLPKIEISNTVIFHDLS